MRVIVIFGQRGESVDRYVDFMKFFNFFCCFKLKRRRQENEKARGRTLLFSRTDMSWWDGEKRKRSKAARRFIISRLSFSESANLEKERSRNECQGKSSRGGKAGWHGYW